MWNKYETEVFRAIGEDRLSWYKIRDKIVPQDVLYEEGAEDYYKALDSLYQQNEIICIVEGNKVMYEKRNKSIQGSNI